MRKLSNYVFPLLLILIAVIVAAVSYVPGTWLLGWDSLASELNFKLNIARSFSAVWQEYQGLGLLGGMAHAADLPRELVLWISSAVIPQSFIRYFWTFLMLTVGPVGVYFLVSKIFIIETGISGKLSGLTAAIFYLFNLAALQTFFVPFETFTTFFGAVPWLIFFALSYLTHGKKRDMVIFAILSVLSTGAFYVQTLFIVYAIFLTVFAVETIIRQKVPGLARSFKLGLVTLAMNAFWLLPVIYFAMTGVGVTTASHINSIATPETQLMNQARGDFSDIATLKGYWFDYYSWSNKGISQSGSYDYLYKDWMSYLSNPKVRDVSITLFLISAAGVAITIFSKKTAYGVSVLALGSISFLMLAGGTLPLGPIFSEAFRNVFTKWSVATSLIYSAGLGYFVFVVSGVFKNKLKTVASVIPSLAIIAASIFAAFPILQGNLISKNVKVNLPAYYLETIQYFEGVDHSARIADFPITDFWGWHINKWGYEGSGFMWYGIPQPILDRTFDVWSKSNENFYSEVTMAVNAKDAQMLGYVLTKYDVSYVLFDGSVILAGNPDSDVILASQKEFLNSSGLLTPVKQFGEMTVYKVNGVTHDSFINAPVNDYLGPPVTVNGVGATPVLSKNFATGGGYPTPKNCDLKSNGSVERNSVPGGIDYKASGGASSCDYFYYPTLDASKMYSLRVSGENISGRSLKIYLYDVTQKNNVLEELLPPGKFDESFYIYPSTNKAGEGLGYTLNVETRSFGKIGSENTVTGINFYPVDFSYTIGPSSLSNNLKVTGVTQYGTWLYKIDVVGGGLLQLSQGYDTGWVAFELPSFSEFKHQKVDGWANAWVIPSALTDNQSIIYIVYWPQLLEFGGFIALAVSLLTVIRFKLY